MSRYPRERIEARLRSSTLPKAWRIFGLGQLAAPLQVQPSPSRFCDGKSGYAVLYAALQFEA